MPINAHGLPVRPLEDRAVTIGAITFLGGVGGDIDRPAPQMVPVAVEICETFGVPIYAGSVVGAWLVAVEAAGRFDQ